MNRPVDKVITEDAVQHALEGICPATMDTHVLDYLRFVSVHFVPREVTQLQEELLDALWPLLASLGVPQDSVQQYVKDTLVPFFRARSRQAETLETLDENKLLAPLENPLVMSEMNWVYL